MKKHNRFDVGLGSFTNDDEPVPAPPRVPIQQTEVEVCLGCGAKTAERDCGCPAGTGLVLVDQPAPQLVVKPPEPKSEPPRVKPAIEPSAMHQTALVFLEDPVARKLAVAWVACGGDESSWFESAGIPRSSMDASRVAKALKVNGVCRAGGVTDPLALQYIQALIARPLTNARKGAERKKENER